MRYLAFSLFISLCVVQISPTLAEDHGAKSDRQKAAKAKTTKRAITPRIINGEDAGPQDVPWQAAIVDKSSPNNIICGAAFIRPTILMTAAHCVDGLIYGSMDQFIVRNGAVDLDDAGMKTYDIDAVLPHPRYNSETYDFDFALVRVKQSYNGTTVRLLTQTQNTNVNVGDMAQVSGWGVTETGNPSNRLQKLDVQIVSLADCNDSDSYDGKITERMLCAGFAAGGRDSCQGDSGGPLTVSVGGSSRRRLAGVVSWGEGCADANKYGVYGRLISVRAWALGGIELLLGQTVTSRGTTRRSRRTRPRIVGGQNVDPGEIRWQAALVSRDSTGNTSIEDRFTCGGSFVTPTLVLTAAHCIEGLVLGRLDEYAILNSDGGVQLDAANMNTFDITDVMPHPQYSITTTDYDFALIRVKQSYTGPTIRVLSARENYYVNVGDTARVSGWGIDDSGNIATTLQKVNVPIAARRDCNDENSYNGKITRRMLCAGYSEGARDACQGDSGGPLTMVLPGASRLRRLIGVVSWGEGCGVENKFGVYGRLIAVRIWLRNSQRLLENVPLTN